MMTSRTRTLAAVLAGAGILVAGLAACSSTDQAREAAGAALPSEAVLSSAGPSESSSGAPQQEPSADSTDEAILESEELLNASGDDASPSKLASSVWPDVNPGDAASAVNPRFCIQNDTTTSFGSTSMGDISPGALVCQLVVKDVTSNPQNRTTLYDKNDPENGFCVAGEDFNIGTPRLTVKFGIKQANGYWCKDGNFADISLREDTKSGNNFVYPYQFQGIRGADEKGSMPSKTMILRISNEDMWPDYNGAEVRIYRVNPRLCIQNDSSINYASTTMGEIRSGQMVCRVMRNGEPGLNPQNRTMLYEPGVINSGLCVTAEDYMIGRPDIKVYDTTWSAGKPSCASKKLKQFDLSENSVSDEFTRYPHRMTASRGPDQGSGNPEKTLVLRLRNYKD